MLLRNQRRRISPRSKRRCREIRNFFLRALGSNGTSSQPHLKIRSSIELNITDISQKINGIEEQLNNVRKHCEAIASLNCSIRESQATGIYQHQEQFSSADHVSKGNSVSTTLLYDPSTTNQRQTSEGDYEPVQHSTSAEEKHFHFQTPSQEKVREMRNTSDDRVFTSTATTTCCHCICDRAHTAVCDCELSLHKYGTQSAQDMMKPAYIDSSCPLSPQTSKPKWHRVRYHRRDSKHERIEPPPPSEGSHSKHKNTTTKNKSSSPQRHSLKKYDHERSDPLPPTDDTYRKQKHKTTTNISTSPQRHSPKKYETPIEKPRKSSKDKKLLSSLDEKFIEDLIQKQYKATKIISRHQSSLSQCSEPVCRDREYSDNARVPIELYSMYEPYVLEVPPPRPRCMHKDRHECRSEGYARSLPARRAHPYPHYVYYDPYNDVELYDMVPVREKHSPKPRRKHVDNDYDICKEVLPSPRTNRPKLNLTAQLHADYEEYLSPPHQTETNIPAKHRRKRLEYEVPDEVQTCAPKPNKQDSTPISSSVQIGNCNDLKTSNETNIKNLIDIDTSHKTDNTLCEIKDILQNFLESIKKETSQANKLNETKIKPGNATSENTVGLTSVPMESSDYHRSHEILNTSSPQSLVTDSTNPPWFMPCMTTPQPPILGITKPLPEMSGTNPLPLIPCVNSSVPPGPSVNGQAPVMPSNTQNGHAVNTYTVAHCNLSTNFPTNLNSCFSRLPDCSVGCINNNQQCHPNRTCRPCQPISNTTLLCQNNPSNKEFKTDLDRSAETEALIKEIHKFVTLNTMRKDSQRKKETQLTTRSVGSSHHDTLWRHDVNVGTSARRYYSKSCGAMSSRTITEMSYTKRSDTIVENLSLDVTHSDSEVPEIFIKGKDQLKKKKTIRHVLKSLFKKKESPDTTVMTTEVSCDFQPNCEKAPFRQDVIDYTVTGQEFNNKFPSPRHPQRPKELEFMPLEYYGCPSPSPAPRPSPSIYTPHRLHGQTMPEYNQQWYSAPYYDPYDQVSSQDGPSYQNSQIPPVYWCEVEVKNTGTQCDKKMSFLQKLYKMSTTIPSPDQNTYTSQNDSQQAQSQELSQPQQLAQIDKSAQPQQSPQQFSLFSKWKQIQEKVQNEEPVAYKKTQRKQKSFNKKIKKAFLKKMFPVKSPFSPNKYIIRTILGNETSSDEARPRQPKVR